MNPETSDNNKALFYIDRWDVFDNLSVFSIVWRGRTWMTVEHAYQAAKFSNESVVDAIVQATSAHETKNIAHLPENISKVNPDWANIKVSIMRELIRAKCDQHPYIKKKLLESGEMEIIEDPPTDDF